MSTVTVASTRLPRARWNVTIEVDSLFNNPSFILTPWLNSDEEFIPKSRATKKRKAEEMEGTSVSRRPKKGKLSGLLSLVPNEIMCEVCAFHIFLIFGTELLSLNYVDSRKLRSVNTLGLKTYCTWCIVPRFLPGFCSPLQTIQSGTLLLRSSHLSWEFQKLQKI